VHGGLFALPVAQAAAVALGLPAGWDEGNRCAVLRLQGMCMNASARSLAQHKGSMVLILIANEHIRSQIGMYTHTGALALHTCVAMACTRDCVVDGLAVSNLSTATDKAYYGHIYLHQQPKTPAKVLSSSVRMPHGPSSHAQRNLDSMNAPLVSMSCLGNR
jgi:hypothetical protein